MTGSDPVELRVDDDGPVPEQFLKTVGSPCRTPREGTKQATPMAMLRAPGGATIGEITGATGCQSHTV